MLTQWKRPVAYGVTAALVLLAVYFTVLSLVSGIAFAFAQFLASWYFVIALAVGFGLQVAFYVRLRHVALHKGTAGVVAVSGGTSTGAMIACCTHYLANVVPVLGATGLVALVAQYQTTLFWLGLAFNAIGLAYVSRKLWQAMLHMRQMQGTA